MTDQYAVIGNPIAHSKSPQIHMLFAEQTGQDINYETVLAPLDDFAATVERLREDGYKGCSVTVPFKFKAFELSTKLSVRAQSAQAVNTLSLEGDSTTGDNTDGAGLVRDIEQNLGILLKDKRVLLMGAGGAAYGVVQPIFKACSHLSITNRTIEKAQRMVEPFDKEHMISIFEYASLRNKSFDVVINATSTGLFDEMPPLPPSIFRLSALAYDMMYGRETPFLKFSREHGAQVADGLGMLVEQAAEAFNIWRGVRPDTAPVITALRAL